MLIGLLSATVASANPKYEVQRAVYGEMSQLRGQNAVAIAGELPVRAKHSKAWIAVREKALKMFGEDHACYKAAFLSQSSWVALIGSPTPQSMSGAALMAFQSGQWSTTCYDEIDKISGPGIAAK